jgi:nucleotide-binding universal stress UspA family protein
MSEIEAADEIVVGLDLSPSSALALHWAAAQARRTGARLRAVHALSLPLALGVAGLVTYPAAVSDNRVEASYREAVTAVWDSVQPEPDWRLMFFGDEPGPVLVRESARSAMLVIGTREHVGFGRILSGSVSHYCLSHARCPIVAVPSMHVGQRIDTDPAASAATLPA